MLRSIVAGYVQHRLGQHKAIDLVPDSPYAHQSGISRPGHFTNRYRLLVDQLVVPRNATELAEVNTHRATIGRTGSRGYDIE